ncbi:MAG: Uma2 family endonuclease [Myxococcales bacterium]|nr:Uma2 family endonuclease [Myxococcales bacterium]MCB9524480.1 Uma2 family endonuclease [Myxococcales bacterium]
MNATALRPTYVSEAEYLSQDETVIRQELLDGEVVVSPAPTRLHQDVLFELATQLRLWSRGTGATVGIAPNDVRFGIDRILQPDVFVYLAPVDLFEAGPINRVPDLCVEVVSYNNRAYDLVTKRLVYGNSGVREYWIIDPNGSAERWFGEGLTQAERVGELLHSPLLPGFQIPLASIFPR